MDRKTTRRIYVSYLSGAFFLPRKNRKFSVHLFAPPEFDSSLVFLPIKICEKKRNISKNTRIWDVRFLLSYLTPCPIVSHFAWPPNPPKNRTSLMDDPLAIFSKPTFFLRESRNFFEPKQCKSIEKVPCLPLLWCLIKCPWLFFRKIYNN